MNKSHLLLLGCLMASISLHSDDKKTDDMLLLLSNDLDKYSQIATATRQNVD